MYPKNYNYSVPKANEAIYETDALGCGDGQVEPEELGTSLAHMHQGELQKATVLVKYQGSRPLAPFKRSRLLAPSKRSRPLAPSGRSRPLAPLNTTRHNYTAKGSNTGKKFYTTL